MALATLYYDSGSGSDTEASGSNAPTTAHTDTTLSQTVSGTTGTSTMTFSGTIDLTGVNDDGTDIIHIPTPSGERSLFRIIAFAGSVAACTGLTVSETIGATTITALGWSIGGKRATLEADTAATDIEQSVNWKYSLEGTGGLTYPITVTHSILAAGTFAGGPGVELVGTGTATPEITFTATINAFLLASGSHFKMDWVDMTGSVSTSGAQRCIYVNSTDPWIDITNCAFKTSGPCIESNSSCFGRIMFCDVASTHASGIWIKGRSNVVVEDNDCHECGVVGTVSTASGIQFQQLTSYPGGSIVKNRCWGNYGSGIDVTLSNVGNSPLIEFNVCDDNNVDGIRVSATITLTSRITILNNILSSNVYGVRVMTAGVEELVVFADHNAYYNNSSGQRLNLTAGANDVTLTADPYTDASSADFTLNSTAGGGADCKDAGAGYNG